MKISAIIFDLNGTVLSDEDEYGEAFANVLKGVGVKVESIYPHTRGIGVEENWSLFVKKYKLKTDKTIEELSQETQNEYYKLIPRITLKNGFEDFVNGIRESGIKTALATSNSWPAVEKLFDRFDIAKYFDCVTTAEEVVQKKPDPQIFVLAAEKLGIAAENCLVIEDSVAGVEAAHAAGMKAVVIVHSPDPEHARKKKKSDLVIEDFDDLSPEVLAKL